MRVLVTGGTGFVGSHLVDRLLEDPGHEIIALVRDRTRIRWLEGHDRVQLVEGDLLKPPALPAGLDAVFHLAGLTKTLRTKDYYTVNRDGTANLLKALEGQSSRLRFIHMSSIAACGPSDPERPTREDDPSNPVSPYGESKLQAEAEVARAAGRLSAVILRTAAIYGPRDEDFLEYFRWMGRGILPLVGSRPKVLSLCYVRDVVRALLLAAEADVPSGTIYNIADPRPYTWEDIGQTVAALLGKKLVPVHIPHWAAFLASAASEGVGRLAGTATALNVSKYKQMRPDCWTVDTDKARRDLGFETTVSLEEGLKETIAWYVERRLL